MSAVELLPLNRELLPAFRPYLLPQAAGAVEEGDDDVLALGAVTGDGRTCGAAAAVLEPGYAGLFSLYVDPAIRRRGVAALLLDGLLERAGRPAEVEAEWILPQGPFQETAAFLTRQGFRCAPPAAPVYRLESAGLRRSPVLRRAFSPGFRPDGNVLPYARLSPEQRAELLSDEAIPPALRPGAFGPDELLPEMSLCYLYRGRVSAYLLVGESGPGECAVLAALSRPGAHPAAFLQTAAAALRAGLDYFGGDFVCWLEAINAESDALARALAGGQLQPWWTGTAVLARE